MPFSPYDDETGEKKNENGNVIKINAK